MNSNINLDIKLDENRVPESIQWSAPDGGVEKSQADAFMLSVWDGKTKDTLRIDLWTGDMLVDDMKKFYHQTLLAMADGFQRATNEDEISEDMRDFAKYFAEKLKLVG
ncbi:MAG: Uncharacterised protein [Owenweeksia sp. TMED14]|nr:MAG: Uncharacterised protein [Owenweeksia sp. TMED14]